MQLMHVMWGIISKTHVAWDVHYHTRMSISLKQVSLQQVIWCTTNCKIDSYPKGPDIKSKLSKEFELLLATFYMVDHGMRANSSGRLGWPYRSDYATSFDPRDELLLDRGSFCRYKQIRYFLPTMLAYCIYIWQRPWRSFEKVGSPRANFQTTADCSRQDTSSNLSSPEHPIAYG